MRRVLATLDAALCAIGRWLIQPLGTRIAVVSLLSIHAGLLAYSATRHSPTHLEPAFLASGISHWQFGRFELYRVNPPLPRMIAALPVLAVGCETDWSRFYEGPGSRAEFPVGEDFIKANGAASIPLFIYARWACIPFNLIGALFAYIWAKELYGNAAGLVTLILYVFEPNLLAHGELVTPDGACTAFGILAGYTFWRWLKHPSWIRAALAGGAMGLAELSKLSWLLLFGLWPLLWLLWRILAQHTLAHRDPQTERRSGIVHPIAPTLQFPMRIPDASPLLHSLLQLTTLLLLALYVINAGYAFDGSFTQLKDFTFVSRLMTGLEKTGTPGNRFRDTVLGAIPLPMPKHYVLGFDSQNKDFEAFGQPSYLRGEWRSEGWWHYYAYGLLVKVPCGTCLLFILVLLRRLLSNSGPAPLRDELVLLVPALSLFFLVSSQTAFNHHLRYVFPSLGLLLVFVGQAACARPHLARSGVGDERTRFKATLLPWPSLLTTSCFGLLIAYSTTSSVLAYPHHLSYFNDFAGGSDNGDRHLLGSSLDWGQDIHRIDEWIAHTSGSCEVVAVIDQQYDTTPLGLPQRFSLNLLARPGPNNSRVIIIASKNLIRISPPFLRYGTHAQWRDWYEFRAKYGSRLIAVQEPFATYDVYTLAPL